MTHGTEQCRFETLDLKVSAFFLTFSNIVLFVSQKNFALRAIFTKIEKFSGINRAEREKNTKIWKG